MFNQHLLNDRVILIDRGGRPDREPTMRFASMWLKPYIPTATIINRPDQSFGSFLRQEDRYSTMGHRALEAFRRSFHQRKFSLTFSIAPNIQHERKTIEAVNRYWLWCISSDRKGKSRFDYTVKAEQEWRHISTLQNLERRNIKPIPTRVQKMEPIPTVNPDMVFWINGAPIMLSDLEAFCPGVLQMSFVDAINQIATDAFDKEINWTNAQISFSMVAEAKPDSPEFEHFEQLEASEDQLMKLQRDYIDAANRKEPIMQQLEIHGKVLEQRKLVEENMKNYSLISKLSKE